MADTMQFDLVSPERSLASFAATEVQIPGSDGDLTAMPNHAPTLTTLRPGVLTAVGSDGAQNFVVFGGFAEISASGVTILAERATPQADLKRADLDALIADMQASHDAMDSTARDEVARSLAALTAMADGIAA